MSGQTPSVGRIVHFVYGDTHCAAIITDSCFSKYENTHPNAGQTEQSLIVFPPNEPPFTTVASLDDSATPATWHWHEFAAPRP